MRLFVEGFRAGSRRYCILSYNPFFYIVSYDEETLELDYDYLKEATDLYTDTVVITKYEPFKALRADAFMQELEAAKGDAEYLDVYTYTNNSVHCTRYGEPIMVYPSDIEWTIPTYAPDSKLLLKYYSLHREDFIKTANTMVIEKQEEDAYEMSTDPNFPELTYVTSFVNPQVGADLLGYLCLPIVAARIPLASSQKEEVDYECSESDNASEEGDQQIMQQLYNIVSTDAAQVVNTEGLSDIESGS